MRKTKIVSIEKDDGSRIEAVVKEISPRMIMDAAGGGDMGAGLALLARDCCGLETEQLLDLYGSEIERLWTTFQEVNTFFFAVAPKLGLDGMVSEMGRNFVRICGEEAASSLKRATDSTTL